MGDRTVRTVTLEFLRAGPPHNQLLSPLTQYLAVCGEAAATVVNVPWEHAPFLRRIEDMRYDDGAGEDDHARRIATLEETGVEVARLLGSIPAMSSVIAGNSSIDEVTHIRLVLSASELALVPFELSKVPSGLNLPADSWLLLQPNNPVCLTRHVRSVPFEGVPWSRRARVLFVAGDPHDLNPVFDDHVDALVRAVSPWLRPGQEKGTRRGAVRGETRYGDILSVKSDASIRDVQAICEAAGDDPYTHIHVLAHGARDDVGHASAYGIGLDGQIVTGGRFASAIANPKGGLPTVVTMASCDSANVGSVMTAGASFAHAVHQAGVPMVVASQFPLSFAGSVAAVERMYGAEDGFLWGENPLFMLQDVRRALQIAIETEAHDWGSVVVYEAMPSRRVLEYELEDFAHSQANAARSAAEAQIKDLIDDLPELDYKTATERFGRVKTACRKARGHFRASGRYAMESLALRGANYKKLAEAEFEFAKKDGLDDKQRATHLRRSRDDLDRAFGRYRRAVDLHLDPSTGVQRRAQPHYVAGQVIALGALLRRQEDPGLREFARISAEAHLRLPDTEERAWALGTLIALHQIDLAEARSRTRARESAGRAIAYAEDLASLFPERGDWRVFSTYREVLRYVRWWGDSTFREALLEAEGIHPDKDTWSEVVDVSEQIVEVLKPRLWRSQQGG